MFSYVIVFYLLTFIFSRNHFAPRPVELNEKILDAESIVPFGEAGGTWTISNMNVSGLIATNSVDIFIREESEVLQQKLDDLQDKDVLFVGGCPGIGKSTQIYGWAIVKAKCSRQSVLWVHYTLTGVYFARFAWNDTEFTVVHFTLNAEDTKSLYAAMLQYSSDVVILDGFRGDGCKVLLGKGMICAKNVLIWCSSFAFASTLKQDEVERIGQFWRRLECILDTWCYDELVAAFHKNIFGDNIRTLDELKEKYYYIGDGGIRLYFFTLEDAIQNINNSFSRIEQYADLLGGLTGDSSRVAVHSLMQYEKGATGPVSKYVTLKLESKVDLQFINEAKNILTDNPSFQGWIFELEVISKIKKDSGGRCKQFFDHTLITPDMPDGTWLIPTKYNQGGFDLLFYKSKGQVEAVQITRAKKHVYKLKFLEPFVNAMKNVDGKCSVLFKVVIPVENQMIFCITVNHFKSKVCLEKFDHRWSVANWSQAAVVWVFKDGNVQAPEGEMSSVVKRMSELNVAALDTSSSSSDTTTNNKKRKLDPEGADDIDSFSS